MDVFDLYAKIGLDKSEYESGLKSAKSSMSNLAKSVGDGLKTVAKVGAAAVAAAATGVAALTKMSVDGYAEYEQLVGGVETLFKTSQDVVMKYAKNAYKTAGLSANEYMRTVTSFSASLIQSLGGDTAKAAEVGDMAITDMSDNANKMGTSIEMIQNAYQGFAKQNYTMLDNLKLGYGGTQEEMQRLIDDANKVKVANGEMADLSIDSFADVAEAIHIIQTEMGITGTTAKEAASTIEGSLAMMKGAWQNLVVGMADENANMEVLIDNFVESVATAAQNLLPRIEQTLIGIGQLITALAPVIADALPVLVEAVLPSLLTAAVSLVTALVNGIITALPAVYDALLIGVQTILVEVFGVSEEKAGEFADSVNSFFVKIKDGFMALVESAQTEGTFLNEVWTNLQEFGRILGETLVTVWNTVSSAFTWCVEQINTDGTLLNGIWTGLQEAFLIVQGVLNAAFEAVSTAFAWAVEQINTDGSWLSEIWDNLQKAGQTLREFFDEIWAAISSAFNWCVEQFAGDGAWLEEIWTKIQDTAKTVSEYIGAYWDALSAVFSWFVEQINTEGTFLNSVFEGIKEYVSVVFENIKTAISTAIDVIQGVIATFTAILQGDWESAWTSVKETAQIVWDAICETWGRTWSWFDEHVVQPINEAVVKPIVEFFTNLWNSIVEIWDWICGTVESAFSFIVNIVKFAFDLITMPWRFIWENCKEYVFEAFEWIKEKVSAASEWISDKVEIVWGWVRDNIVNPVKEAYEKAVGIFDKIKSGISEKITKVKDDVTEAFSIIKEKVTKPIDEAKTSVSSTLDGIKEKFSDIWFGCKKIVTDAVTALKNALKFDWSLPKLKLPHISVEGGEAPYGIGGKGQLPHFSIEWYKKAYDNAMVLSSPTIFGFGGGSFLGGGDGNGNEIVAGESHLMNLIGQVVESKTAGQNEKVIALLSALLTATVDGNEEMVQAMAAGGRFVVGEREFARLVKTYA